MIRGNLSHFEFLRDAYLPSKLNGKARRPKLAFVSTWQTDVYDEAVNISRSLAVNIEIFEKVCAPCIRNILSYNIPK